MTCVVTATPVGAWEPPGQADSHDAASSNATWSIVTQCIPHSSPTTLLLRADIALLREGHRFHDSQRLYG